MKNEFKNTGLSIGIISDLAKINVQSKSAASSPIVVENEAIELISMVKEVFFMLSELTLMYRPKDMSSYIKSFKKTTSRKDMGKYERLAAISFIEDLYAISLLSCKYGDKLDAIARVFGNLEDSINS